MDLVLFVRHGEFYNLFDLDADEGLRVGLNLSGAKGGGKAANMWKVSTARRPGTTTPVLPTSVPNQSVPRLP